ncbi:MAG TPA: tRNA (adenosine(37)-N6)-dimethylallyltransferase MiaA [Rhodanobacteraceae bacterium]
MPCDKRPFAIFLMGPTASGKTALACRLADRFPVELVSVDSALVYRGLDVGAAKPDAATLARYPHHLIDVRDPAEPYSAAEFCTDAVAAMQAITQAGRVPLLVGGTGLYFRALQQGLSPLPSADATLRQRLAEEAGCVGWPVLHARLATLDPAAAARIKPRDAQRIARALEVIELGDGRSLTEQQADVRRQAFPWRVLKLALMPGDRALLHARIARRFDTMLADGFIDEVRGLHQRADLAPDLPAMRAVGYRQAWDFVDGKIDQAALRARAVAATRQLAKRQITWLRAQLDARWLDSESARVTDVASTAVADFVR